MDLRRHARHRDAGVCAISGRHADRCAGQRAHCRHAQGVVEAKCLCRRSAAAVCAGCRPATRSAGEQTYQARCASCHADAGQQQITSPDYLALVGDQALRTIIIAGRPDIGQPDWRHDEPGGKPRSPLSAQDVDDIVAYLASLRSAASANAGFGQCTQPTGEVDRHEQSKRQTPNQQPEHGCLAPERRSARSDEARVVSRRWLLLKAGIALNGLVGLALAVPVVRYLLAPWKKDASYNSWVSLGPLDAFPVRRNAPRVLQESLDAIRGTARPTTSPAMCGARARAEFKVFAINCAHLGLPGALVSAVAALHVSRATAASTMPTARAHPGPPERGLFTYNWQDRFGRVADRRRPDADALQHREAGEYFQPAPGDSPMPGMKQTAKRDLRHGSSGAFSSKARSKTPRCTRFRATPRAGGTSSAAPRSRCSSCRSSPAFCWRWSTFPRRAKPGTA